MQADIQIRYVQTDYIIHYIIRIIYYIFYIVERASQIHIYAIEVYYATRFVRIYKVIVYYLERRGEYVPIHSISRLGAINFLKNY